MERIIISLLSLVCVLMTYAQSSEFPLVGSFEEGYYYEGKRVFFNCEVRSVPGDSSDDFGIIIQASPLTDDEYIGLQCHQIPGFKQSLIEVRERMSKWNDTTTSNNVRDFKKDLKVRFDNVACILGQENYLGAAICEDAHLLWCDYHVDKDGHSFVSIGFMGTIDSGKSVGQPASSVIRFATISQINSLINLLDSNKIKRSIGSSSNSSRSSNVDDLFKY